MVKPFGILLSIYIVISVRSLLTVIIETTLSIDNKTLNSLSFNDENWAHFSSYSIIKSNNDIRKCQKDPCLLLFRFGYKLHTLSKMCSVHKDTVMLIFRTYEVKPFTKSHILSERDQP